MELKQSNAFRVPVRIRSSSTGAGITGVSYNQVTVYIQKQAGSSAQKVLTANNTDWFEIDAANFPGVYDLLLSTTDTNTLGFFKYAVSYSGATLYYGLLEVVANLESDTYARLGAPAGASLAADVAAVQATDTAIKAKTDNLPANTATAISAIPTNPLLTNDARLNDLDAAISSRLATAGYTAPDNASVAAIKTKTDNLPANTSTAIAAIPTNPLLTTDARLNDLDAAISSRLATSGYTAPPTAAAIQAQVETTVVLAKTSDVTAARDSIKGTGAPDLAALKTKTDLIGTASVASQADVNTRLAASAYTAPDNADITAIKAKTDNLPADPASNTQVNTRLATAGYTAPDNASVTAIKAKTDNLPASPAAVSDVTGARDSVKGSNGKDLSQVFTEVDTRLASADYAGPDNADIIAIKAKTDALPANTAAVLAAIPTNPLLTTDARLNDLDAAISSRLSTVGYTAPDNPSIAAIKAKTDNLPSDPASNTQVNTRLAASNYVAPDNADIAAIKAKTDGLPADTATALAAIPTYPLLTTDARLGHLDANVSAAVAAAAAGVSAVIAAMPPAPDNAAITDIKNGVNDLLSEAFGKWSIDFSADTLTLYRSDDTVLKVFQLIRTGAGAGAVTPTYVERRPQ